MQGIPQGPHSQGGSQKPTLSWQSPNTSPKPMQSSGGNKQPQPAPKSSNKPDVPTSNMTTYVGIFIAGLIVGGLLGWAALAGRSPGGAQNNGTSTSTTSTTAGNTVNLSGSAMAGGLQGLVIASQTAGASVDVSNVSVDQPTWVVIYDDQSGVLGRALGAQLFYPVSEGGETSGTVSLIRSTLPGHSYLAAERIDNGDHTYSSTDTMVTNANGQPLTVSFSTK